ncbi:MAG: transporter [Aquificaceae bacterium]
MKGVLVLTFLFFLPIPYSLAGKKALYWDDTETLGKGKYQVENYLFYTKEKDGKKGSYIFNLTYGLSPRIDIALNVPVGYLKVYGNTYSDMADPFFELKYKFYKKKELSFAIKPYFSIPFNKHSQFSEGNVSYGITLVSQLEHDKLTFYANSSYMVHKDRPLGKNELFQSLSFEYSITDSFSMISSLYVSSYKGTEKGGLVGIGYSKGKVELGSGIGKIFSSKNDFTIYWGLTYRLYDP